MVGAGQLARMTHQAAISLGTSLRLLADTAADSAALVAPGVELGDYHSLPDLLAFSETCDVVTFDHVAGLGKGEQVRQAVVVAELDARRHQRGAVGSGVGQQPQRRTEGDRGLVRHPGQLAGTDHAEHRQPDAEPNRKLAAQMPSSRAISMRCTSDVPSPISRILESRQCRATGYSFMKP